MDSQLAKSVLNRMIELLESNENFYFLKTIETFEKLPSKYQKDFLRHFVEGYRDEAPHWGAMARDESEYFSMMRSILFYFSGKELSQAPTKNDLIEEIKSYMNSESFKKVDTAFDADEIREGLETL